MNLLPASYQSPETVAAMQAAAAANGGSDYKALVCFFLYGGADSHNWLVPAGANPNVAHYNGARPTGVRIEQNELVAINGYSDWGLHPGLATFAGRFNPGGPQAAILRHVGTLDRFITKSEYGSNPRSRPDQLFSHNTQQDIWQAADAPDVPRVTGWFGRAASLVDPYFNPAQSLPSGAFSTLGATRQVEAFAGKPYSVLPGTSLVSYANNVWGLPNPTEVRNNLMLYDGAASRENATVRNAVYEAYAKAFTGAIDRQGYLTNPTSGLIALPSADDTALTNACPAVSGLNNPFLTPIKDVLRAVLSRDAGRFNQRRQVFFIGVGGWDHHSSLRSQHDRLTEHLNNAMVALASRFFSNGLGNNVVLFTETEFSRTLTSNATGGTDHAWAGHSLVLGGPVVRGLYGPEPDYTINGDKDTGSGRFIPDISTEQYFATLLKWFGVPEEQLPLVLPNLPAFAPRTLNFL